MGEHTDGLVLKGLDGSNPLGFLAALGTLRGLSMIWGTQCVRIAWHSYDAWHPVILKKGEALSPERVLDALDEFLKARFGHNALTIDDNLKLNPEQYRTAIESALSHSGPDIRMRSEIDFLSSFGSDIWSDNGVIQDTALRTMSGAGHQHFLKSMRLLVDCAEREHIERSLFENWTRSDDAPTLRWDPQDDRRYALRWKEPSGDPIRTELGANRLALEALPLIPTIPTLYRAKTVGFIGKGSRDTYWIWPIWNTYLNLESIRSLLSDQRLINVEKKRKELQTIGVQEIFCSQRLTIGKYRNFSPAQSI